jgi:hypothetical protein
MSASARDFLIYLMWAPVACWSVAGAGLLVIAASQAQQSMARMRPV